MLSYKTFFVFKSSIDKTDIQKGELISLIEMQKDDIAISILEADVFINEYTNRKNSFFSFNDDVSSSNDNSVYIVFFFQTALVISNFELDIIEILRRAGYIQSCGQFIFFSKWERLDIDNNIAPTIKSFHKENNTWYETIFYKKSDNLKENKLSGLLIDDKRYHIGSSAFNSASASLDNKVNEINYIKSFDNKGEGKIFLIKEQGKVNNHSIISDLYPDRNLVDYCICYLSEYKKDNIIHEIDDLSEAKPYWAGIFTTPHILINAMLNLAKVTQNSIVLDPFCHTGTVAIEASQIGCKVISCDLDGAQGAEDNFDFLCNGSENLKNLLIQIEEKFNDSNQISAFQNIIENNIKSNPQGLPEIKGNKPIENIQDLSHRLFFYILRRYHMEIKRASKKLMESENYFKEMFLEVEEKDSKIKPGYNLFVKQYKLFEDAIKENQMPIVTVNKNDNENFTDCQYKTKRVGYINKQNINCNKYWKKDITKDEYEIEDNSLDAVVTDPPYGYGENLSEIKVKEIYSSLIKKSFKWLKPNGYLVFCALDKVKTGRTKGLLFTEDIIEILNDIAKKNKINFISNTILSINRFYPTVYYWKSKYALNRSIICVRITKKI